MWWYVFAFLLGASIMFYALYESFERQDKEGFLFAGFGIIVVTIILFLLLMAFEFGRSTSSQPTTPARIVVTVTPEE